MADARAVLDDVLAELEHEDFPLVLAEALRLRGEVFHGMGRRREAVADLSRAVTLGHPRPRSRRAGAGDGLCSRARSDAPRSIAMRRCVCSTAPARSPSTSTGPRSGAPS
ncbi:MAG: hypothetical protein U0168_24395 [Nannocystaceae bacterium]